MTDRVKHFIERSISFLDNNKWDEFYEEAQLTLYDNREICELTEILLAAGLDPLAHLDYVPEGYLYNNQDIVQLIIPPNIRSIQKKAYCFCGNIKELHIPENCSYIDYNAFCGLTNLETIYFNSQFCQIENEAFDQCYHIKEVIFKGTVEEWKALMEETWCHELEDAKLISCTDGDIHND